MLIFNTVKLEFNILVYFHELKVQDRKLIHGVFGFFWFLLISFILWKTICLETITFWVV